MKTAHALGVVLLFGLGLTVLQLRWIALNADFDGNCVPGQLNYAADLYHQTPAILEHARGPAHALRELLAQLSSQSNTMWSWPRLVYAWSALTAVVIGPDERFPYYSNVLWLLLLAVGLWLLMQRLERRPRLRNEAALIAIVTVSLQPGVFGPMRTYGLDFPLTAICPLVLWSLMRTEDFARQRWSVGFGVLAGLAVMVKAQLIFFMTAPGALALWRGLRTRRPGRRLRLGLLAVLLMAGVSAIWYAGYVGTMAASLLRHLLEDYAPGLYTTPSQVTERGSGEPLSLEWFAFYVPVVLSYLGAPGLCMLILGVALLLRHRRELAPGGRQDRRLLYFAVGSGAFILSVLTGKSPRYAFPLLPLLGVIGVTGVMTLGAGWRRGVAGAVIAANIAGFFAVSWSPETAGRLAEFRAGFYGWRTEFDTYVRPPGEAVFDGLPAELVRLARAHDGGTPAQVGWLGLPQSPTLVQDTVFPTYLPGYRFKLAYGCVDRMQPEFLDREVLRHVCGDSHIDLYGWPRFFEAGSVGDELRMLVVVLYEDLGQDLAPPYASLTPEQPMPEIAYARDAASVEAQLDPSYRLLWTRRYAHPKSEVRVYWRDVAPAAPFSAP